MSLVRASWVVVLLLLWSCSAPNVAPDGGSGGAGGSGGSGGGTGGGIAWGEPLDAGQGVQNVWTWFGFPDSACDDGTPTGIGVNIGTSSNVMVFLMGGGACWDANTCYTLNTAVHGPFGPAQFAGISNNVAATIFDRTLAGNPFADWSFVYVPYCTGDLHAGQNVATYVTGGVNRTYHHVGHSNVLAYLKRLAPTFASAPKVVLAGSSAGGYGSVLNQPDFQAAFPGATLYVLDDSGPLINFPTAMQQAEVTNWRLDLVTDPLCGVACRTDFAQAYTALATTYSSRTALLSSLQDQTIRNYAQLTATQFQTALLALNTNTLASLPKDHVFFVTGQTHTMLGTPARYSQNGVTLVSWLTQFVNDDPAWTSVLPP